MKELELNTGKLIPAIGFGTWRLDGLDCYEKVMLALEKGYRHIDTAAVYGNEEFVGRAIRESKVPREEIFVTTKLAPSAMRNPEAALEESLMRMGLSYVDLYIMHWPIPRKGKPGDLCSNGVEIDHEWSDIQTWELMQKLPKELARSIGVSNFTVDRLQKLLDAETTTDVPVVNQVEMHPLLPQPELVQFCHKHKIIPEAYCPLARGEIDHPIISAIAEKHQVEPSTIALSWAVQRGTAVIPKSGNPERIAGNLKTIHLSDKDMEQMAIVGARPRRLVSSEQVVGTEVFE